MKKLASIFALGCALFTLGCQQTSTKGSFAHDLEFLEKHKKVVVLKSADEKRQVAIVPDYQGRVMTSTSGGGAGKSYGWINYDLISSGEFVKHINVFGGEDRFWLGPEGGQYAIFFENGAAFDLQNWQTPAPIDTEPFDLIAQEKSSASFQKKMKLANYSGHSFDVEVTRDVSILEASDIRASLNIELRPGVEYVGFQTSNHLKNTGASAWKKETGLLSIWILGMFNPSDETTIIIPFKGESKLKSNYFGETPADRLATKGNAVFFKGDGRYRSKIGMPPENIVPVCGSYDAKNQILTIVQYTFKGETDYVNSLWELQKEPYAGDVVNSYNDGPMADGSQLGPFYELESSSSAKALKPNESIQHVHKTFHFEGSFEELNSISKTVLGVDLNEVGFESKTPENVLIPKQANDFAWVYKPAGDKFFGPDTKNLKESQWYDEWVPNDHTFVKDEKGLWHIFGITHPLVDVRPYKGTIHEGEFASFHAISSATKFKQTLKKHHYTDLAKVLPPKERPGEILQNHAPYIIKKDGLYQMVYGHSPIRLAVSSDLSKWELKGNLFEEKDGARDPNLLFHNGTYYMVFCSDKSVRMRTSKDLIHWSDSKTVLQTNQFDPESPSLIFHNNTFYLFVCSWDGIWDEKDIQGAYQHKTYVYQSDDLTNFGVDAEKEITTLKAHAPEIFQDETGQWYLSSVEWPNRGVSVDKLEWK